MRSRPTNRTRPRKCGRGAGLIELVIGSAITIVVVVAVGNAMALMTRGSAGLRASSRLATDAAVAMARLRRELGSAVTISRLTANAITFTHPDLDGDGGDDAIEYSWSGTAGAPLLRRQGAAAALPLIDNVRQLSLAWDTAQVVIPGTASDLTDEVVLASNDSCPTGMTCSFGDSLAITSSVWRGQVFTASMNDTQYFTTTRIRVYIRRTGNSGVLFMSIRSAGGGTVIEEVNTPITSVATGGYIWHEYSLSGLPQFTPGTYYSFMLRSNTASGIACLGRNEYPSNFLSDNMWYFNTDNGGSSFYPTYQRDARFMLYGRFKLNRPQFNPDVTRTWLKSFDIRLTASDGGRTIELRSGTPCPNLPEITGRF